MMQLTPDQLHSIQEILDRQMILFVSKTLGPEMLSKDEKKILKEAGVDYDKLYSASKDPILLNYQLGMLSNVMGDETVKNLSFEDLKKYVQSGQHIPLTNREKAVINNIKSQSLSDIKSAKGRIFSDINNIVNQQFQDARSNQETFIKDQVVRGTEKRESVKQISRNIAKMSGDWSRDFSKSVSYISHTALNEGRAAMLERRYGSNKEAKIWFKVLPGACKSCAKVFLKGGVGSEPKVFTLQEIQANGNNIGKKQADWLPVFCVHPHCRCTSHEYIDGQEWNGDDFVWPEGGRKKKLDRPKIAVTFNGKKYMV